MSNTSERLYEIYHALLSRYGPQGWWPGRSATETIIGAILVQHAAWRNVEQAVANLRSSKLLDFRSIQQLPRVALVKLVRPAGTPNVKAARLQAFAEWIGAAHDFDLETMCRTPKDVLRQELLTIKGIGPETADCIVLYAAGQPSFVVDSYTHRILTRHLLADGDWDHDRLKDLFESNLPNDAPLFNEFHALLVRVGKEHCKKQASCERCPLDYLEHHAE